jgi:plasmid replication initiation protein
MLDAVPKTTNYAGMVPNPPKTPLLADKHPQQDLFVCDVADAVLKDVMQQMEHPFYSLSKKPVTTIREYRHGEHWIRVTPSVQGLATIYDKDLLIYAISQLMARLNQGEEISPRVRINCHEFLIFTNRGTGGKDYKSLVDGLERLRGTTISTNIITGGEEQIDIFGLIDKGTVRRKYGLDGRLVWVDIVLSDWVFNAIKAKEVLTLNRDYFRLSKPYERRAYEIARKHCGRKNEWFISLELLCKKMGATSPLKKFRFFIKGLAESDHLPDYTVELTEEDQVIFRNREERQKDDNYETPRPRVSAETYERAKKFTGRESVYAWEQDWIQFWRDSGCPTLKSADAAFIGFCKSRFVRLGGKGR